MALPLAIPAILGGLAMMVSSLVGRVLIALSIGYVTFTGVSSGIGAIQTQVEGTFTGLPALVLTVAYVLKIDVLVSISFSAVVARLTLKGLTSGALTRMVVK